MEIHVDKLDFPKTRVYIIDEAVFTYPEQQMWDRLFKGKPRAEGNIPFFILLCVHGSAMGEYEWGPVESQAASIPMDRRIEFLA